MDCIDIDNEVACHGFGGIKGRKVFKAEEYLLDINLQFRDKLKDILEKYYSFLEHGQDGLIAYSICRLQDVLKSRKIKSRSESKKTPNGVIVHDAREYGIFNLEDEICFSVRNHEFYDKNDLKTAFFCDVGDSYANFVRRNISIMLAYDGLFKSYPKSDNINEIYQDEVRIKGSIDDPRIIAIGIPLIADMEFTTLCHGRIGKAEFYRQLVVLIRMMLDYYNYHDVLIIDSELGYNLEQPEILEAIDEGIRESESKTEETYTDYNSGDIKTRLRYDLSIAGDIKNMIEQRFKK